MNRTCLCQSRGGASIAEVIVTIALLGTATVGLGRFASLTRQGLQQQELNTRLNGELINARERIGSWAPEQVTVEQIEKIPFSATFSQQSNAIFSEPRWSAIVEPLDEPASALRVTLKLHCILQGQTAEPQAITFWIAR